MDSYKKEQIGIFYELCVSEGYYCIGDISRDILIVFDSKTDKKLTVDLNVPIFNGMGAFKIADSYFKED